MVADQIGDAVQIGWSMARGESTKTKRGPAYGGDYFDREEALRIATQRLAFNDGVPIPRSVVSQYNRFVRRVRCYYLNVEKLPLGITNQQKTQAKTS